MIQLLALRIRRDRVILPIWIFGIALLLTASAASVSTTFGDEAGRRQILQLALATPALIALRGVPNGVELGSAVYFQVYAFLAVAVGLMNTFLATRHGRAEEERGQRELITAAPVRRMTPILSTIILGVGANLLLGVLSTAGFAAAGLPLGGSLVGAAALVAAGLAFLGVGLLASELTASSRAANSLGATLVLIAYALRGAGDALGTPDLDRLTLSAAWPSWLSPIGWGEQAFAFTADDLRPLTLSLALAVLTGGAALVIAARRDLGASLLPERRRPASAGRLLGSTLGLAWRLQWPSLLGWTVGAAVLGAVSGALANSVGSATFENSAINDVLQSLAHTSRDDVVTAFIAAIMSLVGILAAAAGLQAMLRLRDEETGGRAELLLSGPPRRGGWLLASAGVATASTTVVIVVTGLTAWAAFLAMREPGLGAQSIGQALVELPMAMVFVSIGAVALAVLPRISIAATWALFAIGVVIGLFGDLLQLPDAALEASPIRHVPTVPFPADDLGGAWADIGVLTAIAAALIAVATWAVQRRDLTA
ncbi:ABC transporter permease [Naasia lichenicola]|uniref:Polyketide antibiotic transporter n=1 Tax=Naasia lichenicola TaxID=2565933 RepID=A0A4S4FU88_9MICO|nr:polyketide antibiotic transporter [Naasia lichenicola]THG33365.1 polyketide antibiotic transporter [Naasia lichenicola]